MEAPGRGAALLEVRGLVAEFRTEGGPIRPVDGVSFSVGAGETLAVVGESGSGKSVTSLAIMGLLPGPVGRVAAGSILLRRKSGDVSDLARLGEKAMCRVRGHDVAMIFQEPMTSLNPVRRIGSQIAEAAALHGGMGASAARARAEELLTLVDIPDPARRMRDYPHQMSGGMRQRAMIAIALAGGPALLVADEPTTALDVTVQAQVLALLRRLQERFGMGILFVTHNLGVVAQVAGRVVVMYAGRVLEEGGVVDIFHRPSHPYTRGLLASLPRPGLTEAGARGRLQAIPGAVPGPGNLPPGCPFAPRCTAAEAACNASVPELEACGDGHLTRCRRWRDLPPVAAGS